MSHPGNNFTDGNCCNSEEESGNCTSPCSNIMMKTCLVPPGSSDCSNPFWSTVVDTEPRGFSSPIIAQPWPVSTLTCIHLEKCMIKHNLLIHSIP